MGNISQRKEKLLLSPQTIDRLSIICSDALREAEADSKDIIRIGLSLEEILEIWLSKLGEGAVCYCRTGVRFGKQFIEIRVKGDRVGLEESDDSEPGELMFSRLMAQAGLSLVYSYKDGANCLTVNPPKKARLSQIVKLLIAIGCAVVFGLICTLLPEQTQAVVQDIREPLFDTLLGVLRAISSPLIFLAICCGIVSVGDLSTAGTIGKMFISRMCTIPLAVAVASTLAVIWFFPVVSSGAAAGTVGAEGIYQMLLDIVPSDIVSPFVEGNALQIILLGAFVGIALLVLGDRVSAVKAFIEQLNEVVRYLMELICKLLPVFVFLSIFALVSSGMLGDMGGILKGFVLVVVLCLTTMIVYTVVLAIKTRVNYGVLIKKMLPVFLIGLSTASSAAALATNLETCERKLGISNKVVNFAVPLGQVLFRPTSAIIFLIMSLCMAENYQVPITPVWIITAVIVSGLLSIALPPIPGGAMTCYAVLFAQLGIPAPAVAVAIAVDSILDFIGTACNISCIEAEVSLAADKLGMLDRDVLRKP